VPFTHRSLAAREAILAAARARFTEQGYDRTTIRQVASDAGIDPSMVMRYYRNKEGLFAAAVEVDLRLPDLADLPRDEVAGVLAGHFVAMWGGEPGGALSILLRSAVTHEEAAGLSTQLLGIALARYILRLPPVAGMGDEEVVAITAEFVDRILRGPLPTAFQGRTAG
jgi:AcrR family transcriptional regulator